MKITQYIGEITGAFSATIKHAFAKRDTVLYPEVKPDIPGRWRGRIILTKTPKGERCVIVIYVLLFVPLMQSQFREQRR